MPNLQNLENKMKKDTVPPAQKGSGNFSWARRLQAFEEDS